VAGVADALLADVLLVPADGVPFGLYAAEAGAPGVSRAAVVSLDATRPLCDLAFDSVPARPVATGEAAARAVASALAAGAAMLASEQLGTAERCLDMTVAYVKERRQFARPVGSFQALKHRLADVWIQVTQARAAARYAAACLAAGDPTRRSRSPWPRPPAGTRGARRAGVRADARRHRLHLGAPGAPAAQAGQERVDGVRHPDRHRAALARLVDLPPPPP
jgi:alkylation response protein AidB-like acyl-CoA dehydrogenase